MSPRPQGWGEFRSRRFSREAQGTRSAAEGAYPGSPSLGYLSQRDKKGNVPAGHPRHRNQPRVSAQILCFLISYKWSCCAYAQLFFSGSSSRSRATFFCFAKRKYPKKRRPDVRALRCAAGSLCFSRNAAAAELASRFASASNSPRGPLRIALRCSALSTGAGSWWRERYLAAAGFVFRRVQSARQRIAPHVRSIPNIRCNALRFDCTLPDFS